MSKERDSQDLGMNVSTASNALRKQLLYDLAEKLGMLDCHRCSAKIESPSEMTIDHKIPWRKSGKEVELFFDLSNIAFSHPHCNTSAARRQKNPCGHVSTYNRGCRCDLCKEVKAEKARKYYNPDYRRKRYIEKEK